MESRLLTFKRILQNVTATDASPQKRHRNKFKAQNILIEAPDGELAQLLQAAVRELGARGAIGLLKEHRRSQGMPDKQSVLCELADHGGSRIETIAEWLAQPKQDGLDALFETSRKGFHSPIASAAKEGHMNAVKKMVQLYRLPLPTALPSPTAPLQPTLPEPPTPQLLQRLPGRTRGVRGVQRQQHHKPTTEHWAEMLYGACSKVGEANVELVRWLLLPEQAGSSPQSGQFRRHPLLAVVMALEKPGTALGVAAEQGCCKMLSMLLRWLDARGELRAVLRQGPVVQDSLEWSPIGLAAKEGHEAAVNLMLSALDKAIEQGMTEPLSAEELSLALVPALMRKSNLTIIKRLLSYPCTDVMIWPCALHGVRVNSPMGSAAYHGCTENLAVVLAAACERNGGGRELAGVLLRVGEGMSPLDQAAHQRKADAVKMLLEHAPLGVGPVQLSSALVLAALMPNNGDTLRELLRHRADPLTPDADGDTALDRAKANCPLNLAVLQEHLKASGPGPMVSDAARGSAHASGSSGQLVMGNGKQSAVAAVPGDGARACIPAHVRSIAALRRGGSGSGRSSGGGSGGGGSSGGGDSGAAAAAADGQAHAARHTRPYCTRSRSPARQAANAEAQAAAAMQVEEAARPAKRARQGVDCGSGCRNGKAARVERTIMPQPATAHCAPAARAAPSNAHTLAATINTAVTLALVAGSSEADGGAGGRAPSTHRQGQQQQEQALQRTAFKRNMAGCVKLSQAAGRRGGAGIRAPPLGGGSSAAVCEPLTSEPAAPVGGQGNGHGVPSNDRGGPSGTTTAAQQLAQRSGWFTGNTSGRAAAAGATAAVAAAAPVPTAPAGGGSHLRTPRLAAPPSQQPLPPHLLSAEPLDVCSGSGSVLRFGGVSLVASGAMYAAARKALAKGPLKVSCGFVEAGRHGGQSVWEVQLKPKQQLALDGSGNGGDGAGDGSAGGSGGGAASPDAWEVALLEAEERLLVELPRAGAIAAAGGT